MTPDETEDPGLDDGLLEELDEIDEHFAANIDEDERISSGVPKSQRSGDIDFIQMTGLTNPETAMEAELADIDPANPLSFYERGVADVDVSMAPGVLGNASDADAEIIPAPSRPPKSQDMRAMLSKKREMQETSQPSKNVASNEVKPNRSFMRPEAEKPRPEPQAPVSPPPEAVAPPVAREPVPERPAARPMETAAQRRAEYPAYRPDYSGDEESWSPSVSEEPEKKPGSSSHHRRRSGGRQSRKIRRIMMAFALLCVMLAALYLAFEALKLHLSSPEEQFREAARVEAQGDYIGAAQRFKSFYDRFSTHPLKAEALFRAAFLYQASPKEGGAQPQRYYEESKILFDKYIQEFPAAPNMPRVRTLMGILDYRLGMYREAIDQLSDPKLRSEDPGADLAILRVLGRAYAAIGQYLEAHSSFLQAASTNGNLAPDLDYQELGSMYMAMASNAKSGSEANTYKEKAIEFLKRAADCPTITAANQQEIKGKLEQIEGKPEKPDEAPVSASNAPAQAPENANPAPPPVDTSMESGKAASAVAADAASTAPSAPPAEAAPVKPQTP